MIKVYDQHNRYLGTATAENAVKLGKVKQRGLQIDASGNTAAFIQLRSYGFAAQCMGLIQGEAA